jgi:hypothetical protein
MRTLLKFEEWGAAFDTIAGLGEEADRYRIRRHVLRGYAKTSARAHRRSNRRPKPLDFDFARDIGCRSIFSVRLPSEVARQSL